MPFIIVRTRSSGAYVTVDGPKHVLLSLKQSCKTKEDKNTGHRPFKFIWLDANESYRGDLEGKLEYTGMSVRKILNSIEVLGWTLITAHNHGESGSEYIFKDTHTTISSESSRPEILENVSCYGHLGAYIDNEDSPDPTQN